MFKEHLSLAASLIDSCNQEFLKKISNLEHVPKIIKIYYLWILFSGKIKIRISHIKLYRTSFKAVADLPTFQGAGSRILLEACSSQVCSQTRYQIVAST